MQRTNTLSINRTVILHYWNQGHRCAAEVARLTGIPVRTVQFNMVKLREQGSVDHRGANGRSRKITAEDSRAMAQWIRRKKDLTTAEIAAKLQQSRGRLVSRWTVQRHLKMLGYRSKLPRATPMLTQEHKENRVKWAKQHKNDDWSRTIFSDETVLQLFGNTIRHWCKDTQSNVKRIPKNRQKVLVWGAFSLKGKLPCHSFREIMDGPYYVNILQKHLIPIATTQFRRHWRFQQDNDPKHTSRTAKQFLDKHVPETINWPSNSPDVNPMENLWAILKRRVEKRRPRNLEELEKFFHEEWQREDSSVINHLVSSMRRRCLALISAQGERINY